MSDEPPALPPPELPPPEPPPPPPPQRPRPSTQGNLVPWIYGLGFVVLIFALLWIWQNPNPSPDALRPSQITDLVNQVENITIRVEKLEAAESKGTPQDMQKQLAALQTQVDKLPKPAPPPDLAPIQQQIAAIRTELANQPKPAEPANLTPLEQRVSALALQVQGLAPPNLEPIRTQLDALSRQVAGQGSGISQLSAGVQDAAQQRTALTQRVDGLAHAEQDSGKRLQDAATAVQGQVAQLDQRLTALQQQSAQVSSALHAAQRMARLNAAQAALNAGQPVGAIDGAPAALAAFADKPPPTEASLRLAFPQAAQAALDASGKQPEGATFGQRVLSRAQSLITIREGTKVIVGDPAAGLLSEAGQQLDAGDLAGAVAAVSQLTGAPAQAMASWLAQARSLLAARASLHDLLAHS